MIMMRRAACISKLLVTASLSFSLVRSSEDDTDIWHDVDDRIALKGTVPCHVKFGKKWVPFRINTKESKAKKMRFAKLHELVKGDCLCIHKPNYEFLGTLILNKKIMKGMVNALIKGNEVVEYELIKEELVNYTTSEGIEKKMRRKCSVPVEIKLYTIGPSHAFFFDRPRGIYSVMYRSEAIRVNASWIKNGAPKIAEESQDCITEESCKKDHKKEKQVGKKDYYDGSDIRNLCSDQYFHDGVPHTVHVPREEIPDLDDVDLSDHKDTKGNWLPPVQPWKKSANRRLLPINKLAKLVNELQTDH